MFDRIVAALHDAALDPEHWPAASGLIDRACGIMGNSLAVCSGTRGTREEISFARICFGGRRYEDLEREFFRDHWSWDLRLPRLRRRPPGDLVPTADLYTDGEKDTLPAWEFLSKGDMGRGFHVRLDRPDRSQVTWALGDCSDASGWSSSQLDCIKRLLPHVSHFASVRQALADARALGSSFAELLDNTRCGVIQLDGRGRILAKNDRAGSLLEEGDALIGRYGLLKARIPAENAELDRLLTRALPSLGAQAVAGSMSLGRPLRRTRLAVHINPVGKRDWDVRTSRAAVLVLVVDPETRLHINPEVVAETLGLTAAESRLAAMLATGHTLRDIAVTTGRTRGTVRWHLKQIFRKQGISRQADLVRRVLSLEGLPGTPPSTQSSPSDH